MGGLFGSKPSVSQPPAPPAPDNTTEIADAQQAERMRRASAGRASTVLTSPLGAADEPATAAKKLLGA